MARDGAWRAAARALSLSPACRGSAVGAIHAARLDLVFTLCTTASQPTPSPAASAIPPANGSFADEAPWSSLADIEREHIRATLVRTFYNQSAAARLLRIDRASLARKIERFGISVPVARRGRPAGNARPRF